MNRSRTVGIALLVGTLLGGTGAVLWCWQSLTDAMHFQQLSLNCSTAAQLELYAVEEYEVIVVSAATTVLCDEAQKQFRRMNNFAKELVDMRYMVVLQMIQPGEVDLPPAMAEQIKLLYRQLLPQLLRRKAEEIKKTHGLTIASSFFI